MFVLLLLLVPVLLPAQLRLPKIFSDGMVMQRNQKVKVWGWANPGEDVSVVFNNDQYSTSSSPDGSWSITLSPAKPGGSYTLQLASGEAQLVIEDILIGDVWLCSGQSNMVHNLGRYQQRYEEEIEVAHYPEIRQFLVPNNPQLIEPQQELTGGSWKQAVSSQILDFSVVAYFFALEIYKNHKIPIGLINASVGGTPIESWISESGFRNFDETLKTIAENKDTASVYATNRIAREAQQAWYSRPQADKGMLSEPNWYDPTYEPKDWKRINIPGYWEDQGIRNLNGVVWYRRSVWIRDELAGQSANLALGRIVDADECYVNGQKVGSTTYQYPQRRYPIPEGLLVKGENILTVRVTNYGGKGGFVPDKPYELAIGDDRIDLKGYWQYKVGEVFGERDFPKSISLQNQPTTLYNGMIAPYTDYPLSGVLWYQGESNSWEPKEYEELLPALVNDWRSQFSNSELPFFVVQLPNFMEVNYTPEESSWAELRQAQLEVLKMPKTGLAVTIDLGEWNDIHPGRKKPVGERLALIARNTVYGEKDLVYSGPVIESARRDGQKVVLTFDHSGSGLVAKGGEPLAHFAVAGEDQQFKWADASIQKDDVVLICEDVDVPEYVRYAWADNPDFANLYNEEGLPAAPFMKEVAD